MVMKRRVRAILFVISAMMMVLLVALLLVIVVTDVDGSERTRAAKVIFLVGAIVLPFFVLLGTSLRCNACNSRLITFARLGDESTSWNTALLSLVSDSAIVCRACGKENRLRN